jgi:hypothetical protein
MEKKISFFERASCSEPNSPKRNSGRDRDSGDLLRLLDARFKRRLEVEETRFKESEDSACDCATDVQVQLKKFFIDIPVSEFDIPVSNHTPVDVIRLFPESEPTYRQFTICGIPVNANQKIHFLEICYDLISKALGLTVNSASLAWELCALIKSGSQCHSPAQQVMNALTFNHWANAWIHILPRHFPDLFRSADNNTTTGSSTALTALTALGSARSRYQAKVVANTSNVPMSDYAVIIQKGRIRCIQRKRVYIVKKDSCKTRSIADVVVELHSFAKIRELKRRKSFAKWTGAIRIHPPLFELDASPTDQKNILEIFKPK